MFEENRREREASRNITINNDEEKVRIRDVETNQETTTTTTAAAATVNEIERIVRVEHE